MLKKALAAAAVTAAAAGMLLAGATSASAYSGDDAITSGNGSILSGNQVDVDANVPANVCGNAIAIIGIAGADCYKSGAFVID
ncbi:chaplin family protein [Actinorugispora endophytica]|uniref:Small secreted domain DUF320 n=1 Tax=Actinorugispora endophytica TaxID=1605990 RepID=A0A4R6VDX1_9ACTN|nr:chaplin family protein [Actinorugispora endophytica]TDQ55217.1 small secreted domain DUF320 [Actinorugispora endophytica]